MSEHFFLNVALWKQHKYINSHPCLREALWLVCFYFFCLRKPFWFVYFYLLHSIKIVIWCLNFEQVKVWTFINLMNNIVIVLICAKCLKLITSEENVRQKKKVLLFLEMQVTKKIFTGVVAIKKKFYQFKWFFEIKFSDKKLI